MGRVGIARMWEGPVMNCKRPGSIKLRFGSWNASSLTAKSGKWFGT